MNSILYASILLGTIVLIVASVICIKAPKQEGYVFCFEETKASFGLTILAIGIGYGFMIYKIIKPDLGGSDTQSYIMTALVGFLAVVLAAYTILHTMNKKIYVYEDYLLVVDAFARVKKIPWEDINRIERPGLQRAARFTCTDGVVFTVSGANKNYKKFMNFIRPKLKGIKGKKLIQQIERNLQ